MRGPPIYDGFVNRRLERQNCPIPLAHLPPFLMRSVEMSRVPSYVLAIVVACIAFVGSARAEEASAKKKEPTKAAKRAEEVFKKLDANEDGKVCIVEFKGKRKRAEAIKKAEEIFKLIDKNGDGTLCLEEFTNKPPEARFKTMDRNDDGVLTFDEYKGRREKPEEIEEAEQRFKKMDKDGDRKLTLKEFTPKKRAGKKAAKKARKRKSQPELLKSAES